MRLFGYEISKGPPPVIENLLWNAGVVYENGRQINTMTPRQLRAELTWVLRTIHKGGTLRIDPRDAYKRIRACY